MFLTLDCYRNRSDVLTPEYLGPRIISPRDIQVGCLRSNLALSAHLFHGCPNFFPPKTIVFVMLSGGGSSKGRSSAVEASLNSYDSWRATKLLRVYHG